MRLRSCSRFHILQVALWYSFISHDVSDAFRQGAEHNRKSHLIPARFIETRTFVHFDSRLRMSEEVDPRRLTRRSDKGVGGYDPSEKIGVESINVGDPQIKVEVKDMSVTSILKELAAIQQQGPRKYCILGTRHCSYLHQQIIELL